MIRHFVLVLGVITALPALAETKIAVLPVQAKSGMRPEDAELLTDVLTAEIARRKDFKVIGAAELTTLVTFEQQKTLLACADDSCLAEVGAALGVDMLVSGSVGELGGVVLLNLVLMDARKSVVLARQSERVSNMRELVNIIPSAAATLMQVVPGGPPPAAPSTTSAASPATTPAASPAAAPAAQTPAKDEGGGSSMPRRLGGLAVAGVGGVLLLAGVGLGLASLGWLLAGRFAVPVLTTGVVKYGGFGVAGLADVLGITALVLVGVGVVIAAIP